MRASVLCILTTFLLSSCGEPLVHERLADIDSLMAREQYDSAIILIEAIDEKQIAEKENLAHYRLQKFLTCYFANRPLPADSILESAISFYTKTGDTEKLSDCYYCKAFRLCEEKKYQEAILNYKKAEELSVTSDQRYRIAHSISSINSRCGEYGIALKYAQNALMQAELTGRNDRKAYSLYLLGLAHYNLGRKDSALYYFDKTTPLIKYVEEADRPYFLSNLSLVYIDEQPEIAKQLLNEALSYKELAASLDLLASIYYDEGDKEEAACLWTRALAINDLTPKDNIIHNLLEYDIERGKTDRVCEHVNNIIAIKDSVINTLKNDTIKDLQNRYDHEVAMNAANMRLIHWQWGLGITISGFLLFAGYAKRRKEKMKAKILSRQTEIMSLIEQMAQKDEEAARAEKLIVTLQDATKQKDDVIEELTQQKEEANAERSILREKLENWAGEEAEKMAQLQ